MATAMMAQHHIDGFLAEVKRINPSFTERRSSLEGLFIYLRNTSANPLPMTSFQARQHCGNPLDARLSKYQTAINHLASVWSTPSPYPGVEVAIGRMVFRGDGRSPDIIFANGFAAHQAGAIQYRDAQQDIDPATAVAVSPNPYVAANFPLPSSWGPNAFQMASAETCWVYALYMEHGYNTAGQQSVNALAGAGGARAVLYAGEMATGAIPANHVLAAVKVSRTFNWVHIPKPADWLSRGTFSFLPATYRENNGYAGPSRGQFEQMVRNILRDGTQHAFPH